MAIPDAILEHGLNDIRAHRAAAAHHMAVENGEPSRSRAHDGAEHWSRFIEHGLMVSHHRRPRGVAQFIRRGERGHKHSQTQKQRSHVTLIQ